MYLLSYLMRTIVETAPVKGGVSRGRHAYENQGASKTEFFFSFLPTFKWSIFAYKLHNTEWFFTS